jgi:hypothetical protein
VGFFDPTPGRLVQPRQAKKLSICLLRRHPSLEHHPTWARDSEQIAVPHWLGRVGSQRAVGAVVVDELFKVSEEAQWPPLEVDSMIPHGQIEG